MRVRCRLPEWSNDLLIELLGETGYVCALGSEEVEGPISPPGNSSAGRYAVSFDPVDGSSNIDIAAPVGTIFSIQRRVSESGSGNLEDLLQQGSKQAAAGYILYGSSTMFVFTTGQGVHAFTLDPTMGEFHLTTADLKFPEKSNVYSTNEGNAGSWAQPDLEWVNWIKQDDPKTGRPYSSRYIGALVADFHRILLKGGIFAYPGNTTTPNGKLRLLYECAPMAFIAEQAGGAATNGTMRILDIDPSELHQRTPFYIGTAREVELVGRFHGAPALERHLGKRHPDPRFSVDRDLQLARLHAQPDFHPVPRRKDIQCMGLGKSVQCVPGSIGRIPKPVTPYFLGGQGVFRWYLTFWRKGGGFQCEKVLLSDFGSLDSQRRQAYVLYSFFDMVNRIFRSRAWFLSNPGDAALLAWAPLEW